MTLRGRGTRAPGWSLAGAGPRDARLPAGGRGGGGASEGLQATWAGVQGHWRLAAGRARGAVHSEGVAEAGGTSGQGVCAPGASVRHGVEFP